MSNRPVPHSEDLDAAQSNGARQRADLLGGTVPEPATHQGIFHVHSWLQSCARPEPHTRRSVRDATLGVRDPPFTHPPVLLSQTRASALATP